MAGEATREVTRNDIRYNRVKDELNRVKYELEPRKLEQEPFINKPCVSEKVCEHDKKVVLDKIRAGIEQSAFNDVNGSKFISVRRVNRIIDKCKAESEDKE